MDYWQKQVADKPLYKDILWSRPETRHGAGKLLIAGGNIHGFANIGQAYQTAQESGIGTAHVLLPDAIKKTVGKLLENTDFGPSTPSGSFGSEALGEFLVQSSWADGVLLAGDFGRNSETSILLEKYTQQYSGILTVTKDAVDYFYHLPTSILDRENTMLVVNLSQLQKLGTASKFETPFLLGMGLMLLVQALHEFSKLHRCIVVTKELDNIVVAYQGNISTTKLNDDKELWQVQVATKASVFWLQNPNKPFESITSSIIA